MNGEKVLSALKEIRDRAVAGVYSGSVDCYELVEIAERALREPPRNCDLPDPEDRFSKFCMSRSCESCPFQKSVCCRCKWLMATESEVAK